MLPQGIDCIGLVQGIIDTDTGTILHGMGFSIVLQSPGIVDVTLNSPALLNPSVTIGSDLAANATFVTNQVANTFTIFGGPGIVNFTAVGPCPPSTNPP